MKIGIGYDIHRLVEGRELILGGVKIDYSKGLLGHSDADVLLHAIMDALLGAMGSGNIGVQFPNTDEKFKDADSLELLKKIAGMLKTENYKIVNIDSVIIAENPKLNPHIPKMKENLAKILDLDIQNIGIKATTNEGLDEIGQGNAIKAEAVALILKSN